MKQTKEQKRIADLSEMLQRAQARVDIYQSMMTVVLSKSNKITAPNVAKLSVLFDKLAKVVGN